MAKQPPRFAIGDEISLRGIVRLVDAAGEGTVTVEVSATGQRITLAAASSHIELVVKAKRGEGFTKAPKGRQVRMFPEREE